MLGVTSPLQSPQLHSWTKCLPVQYEEGVCSLMKQAQLVGQSSKPLDACMGLKPCV